MNNSLRMLVVVLALVLAACSSNTNTTEGGRGEDKWTVDVHGNRVPKGHPDAVKDSASQDTAFKDFDKEIARGEFDLDIDGDGIFDAYEEDYEKRIAELSEPDRTQATKDYNPAPGENELVQVDSDAQPLNLDVVHAAIIYPESAIKDGKQGTVRLKLLIDMDGWYADHVLRGSPDRRLTNAVLEQVKKLRYKPAMKGGKPVKVWVNFEHTFKLPKK